MLPENLPQHLAVFSRIHFDNQFRTIEGEHLVRAREHDVLKTFNINLDQIWRDAFLLKDPIKRGRRNRDDSSRLPLVARGIEAPHRVVLCLVETDLPDLIAYGTLPDSYARLEAI